MSLRHDERNAARAEGPSPEVRTAPTVFHWRAPAPSTRDLVVAAAATIASMVLVMWLGRDTWFFADAWDFLDRDLAHPGSLIRPHNGHLQAPVAVVHQVVYSIFGLDFWPWYFLPRAIGYGSMAYATWYVIRRRGADPLFAWLVLGYLLLLGSSTFLTAATIGHHLVIPAVALAAAMYDAGGPHNGREKLLLAGLIGVTVISTSLGVAAAAALGIVALATGRLRSVFPSFAAVGALYAVWYLSFPREGGGDLVVTSDAVLALPELAWTMLPPALSRNLALPAGFGPALVLLLVAALLWWLSWNRLTSFDAVWIGTAVVYMAMVILLRVVPGRATIDSPRYGYMLVWLLILVVGPNVRFPQGRAARTSLAIGLVALVGIGNVARLNSGFDGWTDRAEPIRVRVETVGALLAAGEPGSQGAHMDIAHGRDLTVGLIEDFLKDGWVPTLSSDETDVAAARGVMRLESTTVASRDIEACTRLQDGDAIQVATGDDNRLVIQGNGPTTVEIEWVDEFGIGLRTIEWRGRRTLFYPENADATVTLSLAEGGMMTVCSQSLVG